MLCIDVEFLHSTFRADPTGTSHTGRLTQGEWPPAPSRLLAAMIAADGTGERCRVTDGHELRLLEQAGPPVIHADPDPHHQELQTRYVVLHTGGSEKKTHHEYAARSGVAVHPGVRVATRYNHATFIWEEIDAPLETVDALKLRAARIGYLGTADSPVRVRVLTKKPDHIDPKTAFVPDITGNVYINVPKEGHLQLLDAMFNEWVERGAAVGRSQYPALRNLVAYRHPSVDIRIRDLEGSFVSLRLHVSVSGRKVGFLTNLFKKAVLNQHQRIHGEPPPVLHGHGFKEKGYELARFLALPNVGYEHSKGQIHGLAVWLPPGLDSIVSRKISDSVRAVRKLYVSGREIKVAPWEEETAPYAANPDRWTGRSRRWVTAIPAIYERYTTLTLDEVAKWCTHAGLPKPIKFRSSRHPLVRGGINLAPVEVHRHGRPSLPYSHVELVFTESVSGPVVIGSGRQRGFGLCIPVDDHIKSNVQRTIQNQ